MGFTRSMRYGLRYHPYRKTARSRTQRFKGRYGTRVTRKRRRFGSRAGRVAKVAKNVMMNLAENKVRDRSLPPTPGALASYYHNTLYFCQLHNSALTTEHALPTAIAQGDENFQRNGREIYSTGFRVKGVLDIPFDRRNTTVKIFMVENNSNQGSLTAQLFHTGGGSTGNKLLDRINTERFPGVKLLRTLRVSARDLYVERGELTDGGSLATLKYDIWIPFKRKLTYKDAGGWCPLTGAKETVQLIYLFYDAAETLETDAVCTRCEQLVTFYYKDP